MRDLTYGNDGYGRWCRFSVRGITQTLRWISPGHFVMGSPEDEEERFVDEGPQVEITFSEGFWIFDTPVTQELYEAVMGENPSHFANRGENLPVEFVSWYDAQKFMDRLNGEIPDLRLRLPYEAEWEYACRAGSTTPFEPSVARTYRGRSITTDEVNYHGSLPYGEASRGECRAQTVPVKGRPFQPNAWGLWHMHGNVDEWCEDVWYGNHVIADVNGTGVQDRVVRGGAWYNDAGVCRAACRFWFAPDSRYINLGFRPVAEINRDTSMKPRPEKAVACTKLMTEAKKKNNRLTGLFFC